MTATAVDRQTKSYDQGLVAHPVAAATTIFNGIAVALDVARRAVSPTDSAAVLFAGVSAEGVINTVAEGFGAAGDLNVKVYTRGIFSFVAAGLALADVGKNVYFADNQTVQLAPTNVYAGKLVRFTSATEALVDIGAATTFPGASAVGTEFRVPANRETAAFTPAVNATWEDYDIITALNLVMTTPIALLRSVRLRGVMEFINTEAVVHRAKYGDGDIPDNDDVVMEFTTLAAAGSEYANVELVTDAAGQIKIEVDDRTKLTMIFHLKGFSYVTSAAVS